MNISPVNNNVSVFNKLSLKNNPPEFSANEEQNSYNLSSPSEISGRSLVNFKGTQMHKLDKLFVDTLANELKFGKEDSVKLNQIVTDYLKELKLTSLSDIGGEQYIDEQCDLADKINAFFNLADRQSEYVVSEIVNRCDSKDDYKPDTFGAQLFEQFRIESIISQVAVARAEDSHFSELMAKSFRLNKDQAEAFNSIVMDFLDENKLISLKDIAGSEYDNEAAILLERLSKKLDLSDNQSDMLAMELVFYTDSAPDKYVPHTFPVDNDIDVFEAVCAKNGFSDKKTSAMFNTARNLAVKNNCNTIFEMFTNKELFNLLKNTPEFKSVSPDFLIDMYLCVDNFESLGIKVAKNKASDTFYAKTKDQVIVSKLKSEYGFSDRTLLSIIDEVTKRHPEYIDGGCAKDVKQIAFELADKYNLDGGAEKRILQIIEESDALDRSALDRYIVEKLKSSIG